ncbi:MAG: hypothetical protein ACN6OP_30430, partial [Pseudomonadales bacterium]
MGHLNSRLSGYSSSSNGSALAGSAGLLPCFTDLGLRAMGECQNFCVLGICSDVASLASQPAVSR